MHHCAPQLMKTTGVSQIAQMKTLEKSLKSAESLLFAGQIVGKPLRSHEALGKIRSLVIFRILFGL
ncbi:MAG: hypothetical protein DYG89_49795 [Caldilinea sp. CFX5]|nr:hypothetical protein [Caldilinea sp. CFX5]